MQKHKKTFPSESSSNVFRGGDQKEHWKEIGLIKKIYAVSRDRFHVIVWLISLDTM